MTTKKQKAAERAEAIETLRDILAPGDTVYCVLRHVSRSGMMRHIDFYKMPDTPGDSPRWLSWLIGRALDLRLAPRDNGLKVSGCGMDMGFHVVYNLSATLYRGGFGCIGDPEGGIRCPSNDHSNGDRDYTPHLDDTPQSAAEVGTDIPAKRAHRHYHNDGGYALTSRWL